MQTDIEQEFNDHWFNGGQEEAEANLSDEISEEILKRQPSYPNEENAFSEALYELALTNYKNNKTIK